MKNISSPEWRRKYFFCALLIAVYVVSFSACKDPEELGLEVLPATDQLSVRHTDSTTIFSKTVKEDSLLSKNVNYQLLGSYTDPVFGRSDASFYTQVALGSTPNFGNAADTLHADSLILSFAYIGYYGDTTTTQIVHVYKLTQDILADSAYYTNTVFTDSTDDLANSFSFTPKPHDSVMVGSSNQPAQLRIPLPLSLAREFLSQRGLSTISSNSNWLSYFKGLHIKTDPVNSGGAISYFDLYNSPYSKLTLYFKKNSDTTESHYDFNLGIGAYKVNHQEHDYNGTATDVGHQITDSTYKDSLNYVQAMAGVKTKISFPYLKHFLDSGNVAINKADLEITIQPGSGDVYASPPKLILIAIDSTGGLLVPVDYRGTLYDGESYNTTKHTYTFKIPRHIQEILTGRTGDYGFYIAVPGGVIKANRAIIGSGKNSSYRMKLNLIYTKLH